MNAQQRKQNMKRTEKFRKLLVQMMEELADVLEQNKESPQDCARIIRQMIADTKEPAHD